MSFFATTEKRAHARMPCNCIVNLTDDHDENYVMMASNYSCGGLSVISSNLLKPGDFVQVKFKLKGVGISPTTGESLQHEKTAEVMQIRKMGALYVAGLRFLEELKVH